MPMISATLRLMKGPAELAGLGELHAFLSRGHAAFRHMRGAAFFLDRIVQSERALMEALFEGANALPQMP